MSCTSFPAQFAKGRGRTVGITVEGLLRPTWRDGQRGVAAGGPFDGLDDGESTVDRASLLFHPTRSDQPITVP